MSRTVTVKPVGALASDGSCDSERCVFAMQMGRGVEAHPLELGNFLARSRLEQDPVRPLNMGCDRLDLALDRLFEPVVGREARRLFRRCDDRLGECLRAFAAAEDGLVRLGREGPVGERDAPEPVWDLLVRVCRGSG